MILEVMKNEKRQPPAPDHLSSEAKEWWLRVIREWEIDTAQLPILEVALGAWDRLAEARQQIAEDGLTFMNQETGVRHAHPAVSIERDARREFRLAWKQLGLETEIEPSS